MDKNFNGLFFGGQEARCPYCRLKFQSINELKLHKETYCATKEQYELVKTMFMKHANDIKIAGRYSSAVERTICIMKGLYKLKAEFDMYQGYMENPTNQILTKQKDEKFKEANTKKPNFTAMFSDFNPEAENLKEYPFLQTTLENNYGEDLESFMFRGENTSPEEKKNLPSWMLNKVAAKEAEDQNNTYVQDVTKEQMKKVMSSKMQGKDALDLLIEDPEYAKIFNILSQDIRGENEGIGEIQKYLTEPVASWEDKFFSREDPPDREESEEMIAEIEHPNERNSKYANQMRDLYAVYDSMTCHLMTEVDLDKRGELQKLIAEREFLFYRENLFLDQVEKFKNMFLKRLDYVMYRLSPKPELDVPYRNLYLKLKYSR